MNHGVFGYIFVMALVTYLIRSLPLTLIRQEIKSPFIKFFLMYVPYATLAAMTFPAILTATNSVWSALAGFAAALVLAFMKKSLIMVAAGASAAVFVLELILLG